LHNTRRRKLARIMLYILELELVFFEHVVPALIVSCMILMFCVAMHVELCHSELHDIKVLRYVMIEFLDLCAHICRDRVVLKPMGYRMYLC
jgi:hypothetical protein